MLNVESDPPTIVPVRSATAPLLEDGKGIEFYNFREIPNVKEFIEGWYGDLNACDLTTEEKEAIVDEANLVFTLNIALFDELDGNAFAAVWRLAVDALRTKLGL